MNIRALATAVALAAGVFTAAGTAHAAARVGPLNAAPRPPVVDLRAEFAAVLARTEHGPIAGVLPALGTQAEPAAAPAAPAAPCTEPNCPLDYHGGQVQRSPRVYLVFWGDWSSETATTAQSYLIGLYKGLGVTPEDTWSAITKQYRDGSGSPAFGAPVLAADVSDPSTPPNPVTPRDVGAEAAAYAARAGLTSRTSLANAQVVVASAPGTCFSDGFAGNPQACASSVPFYCGWHSFVKTPGGDMPYTNLPFQLDAMGECGENWINPGYSGEFDGFTTVAGHEFAESVTDPFPNSGWVDQSDVISGGEIADKCEWGGGVRFSAFDPAGDVTLATGSYAMQSLWSNAAGGCVLTTSLKLTVTVPSTRHSLLGASVALQVGAATNSGYQPVYAARGLPPGLSIGVDSGLISGRPSVTAGTWHPVVTVTAGPLTLRRSVTFAWQVGSKPGVVRGYAGKCVTDSAGATRNGTKIGLWACTGTTPQRITFAASGELRVVGKCVTSGRVVAFLWSCNGSAGQTWTRLANGSYVAASTRRCLTAPSAENGGQLTLAACKNSADQHWSLP